jgi:hypothetical protein
MAWEFARRLVLYPAVPIKLRSPSNGESPYCFKKTYAIDWTNRMTEGVSKACFLPPEDDHERAIAKHTQAFEQWARANNR